MLEERQNHPDSFSPEFIDLINKMLSADLNIRPKSIPEVLAHPYFASADLNDIEYVRERIKRICEMKV